MDFALNEEQLEYKEKCRTFAREVIRPAARKHDEEESTPWDVIKEARKQGFGGLEGIQRSASDAEGQMQVISAEEFHWGCAGIALAISGSGLAAAGIASSGTPEQIARWVPECFGDAEEIKLGAYAVTEPQAGSDVKSLKTTAKRDGDEWVLNGTKVFITNGGITRGQASFVIPKGAPGLSQGKKETKLGIRASHTAEIVLEDCRIPAENLLGCEEKLEKKLQRGREGKKSRGADALATFEVTRPLVGASALGIAQASYEWTLEYLDGRAEGGTPLLQTQRIQQTLADVATDDGLGRPLRLEHRVPAREVVPRREDLPAVRGHRRDPADGHLAHAGARVRRAARLWRRSRREGDGGEAREGGCSRVGF